VILILPSRKTGSKKQKKFLVQKSSQLIKAQAFVILTDYAGKYQRELFAVKKIKRYKPFIMVWH
jgi:ribosomal protein L10